jgi:hypothetical protein
MAKMIRAAKWFAHRIKTRCSAIEISVVVSALESSVFGL